MLRSVEHQLANRTVGQSSEIRFYLERATVQYDAAQAMLESDNVRAALEFAKASAVFHARALLTADGIGEVASFPDAEIWRLFEKRVHAGDLPKAPRSVGDPVALVARLPELQVSGTLESEAVEAVDQLLKFLEWINEASEVRSLVDVRHQRIRRVTALCTAIVACCGFLVYSVFAPKNLALHRSVTLSSNYPKSIAGDGDLVDGIIDQPYGVLTNAEAAPWVIVDLGAVRKLTKVKVFNRGDGQFDEVLPLRLELSIDGTTFTEVDRRTTPFTQSWPWVASLGGQEGRYIRVKGKENGWVALSELEAYGQ